jgi:hypothetical protein
LSHDDERDDMPVLKGPIFENKLLKAVDPEDSMHRDFCDELTTQHRLDDQQLQHKQKCDCKPNKWGCDSMEGHKPHQRHIEETKKAVQSTVIPVQQYITEVTQNTTSDLCHASAAVRARHDKKEFQV